MSCIGNGVGYGMSGLNRQMAAGVLGTCGYARNGNGHCEKHSSHSGYKLAIHRAA